MNSAIALVEKSTCFYDCLVLPSHTIKGCPQMPTRPPEVTKQDIDNLRERLDHEISAIEGKLRQTDNALERNQTSIDSKPDTKTLITLLGTAVILFGIITTSYLHIHSGRESSIESSINAVGTQIGKNSEQDTKTQERLAKVEARLELLLGTLLKEYMEQIDVQKPNESKVKLETVKALLTEAKQRDILIDGKIIADSGNALLAHHEVFTNERLGPVAWNTATQFAQYRSFLYQKQSPIPVGSFQRIPVIIGPNIRLIEGYFEGVDADLNRSIIVDVVFRNSTIRYQGEELSLTRVGFENCFFQVERSTAGIEFLKKVLSANPVTFSSFQESISEPTEN